MKIFYTKKAVGDLKRVYDFLVKESAKAAAEVAECLQQAIERLRDFPLLGRELHKNNNALALRDLVTGNYLIRYLVINDEIHILRIWHGKENLR